MGTLRTVTGWFVFVCILHGTPLWAQTAFPDGGRAIIEQMVAKFPELAVNDDDIQRELTVKIGEQFRFTFGPDWGGKKRSGPAPRSKDSIAVKEPDGTISVWDMFSSSVAVLVNDGDLPKPVTHANLPPSEAEFIADEPVNHLGILPDPGPIEPDPGTPPDDELEQRLSILENTLRVTEAELRGILDLVMVLVNGLDERARADRTRIQQLEARPIPLMGCRAAIAGIPISCRLQ